MNRKGITLTELLVASILIGIVMIGVASFSASITHLQSSTNRSTLLSIKTSAVMHRITRDAYLAAGDETNRGVVQGGVGNKESICFRHDADVDPSSYTGDTWVCYFINAQQKIYLCNPGLTPPVDNWGACKSGVGNPTNLITINNATFFTVVNDVGVGPLEYIEIDLTAIFNRTKPVHPIENPIHKLKTQIKPPGHSNG